MKEKRRFTRVGFQTKCRLTFSGVSWRLRLVNVSLKGALVESDELESMPVGTEVVLTIFLEERPLSIRAGAQAVHMEGRQAGFKFLDMDLESLTLLKSVLQWNTGDADAIEEELFFLREA